MKFMNPYLKPIDKIDLLQRWILVHSYLYYELNDNLVTDMTFDNNCAQLADLQEEHKDAWKESRYYYAMHDFDGSTGFGFHGRLEPHDQVKIEMTAHWLQRMKEQWR